MLNKDQEFFDDVIDECTQQSISISNPSRANCPNQFKVLPEVKDWITTIERSENIIADPAPAQFEDRKMLERFTSAVVVERMRLFDDMQPFPADHDSSGPMSLGDGRKGRFLSSIFRSWRG